MAVVGVVATAVPEYFRGNFGDLAGISIVPAVDPSKRSGSGQHGRSSQHRECFRQGVLGLGIRFNHQTCHIRGDISGAGRTVLGSSQHKLSRCGDAHRICNPYVLRRWIRHYAGIRGITGFVGPIYGSADSMGSRVPDHC